MNKKSGRQEMTKFLTAGKTGSKLSNKVGIICEKQRRKEVNYGKEKY